MTSYRKILFPYLLGSVTAACAGELGQFDGRLSAEFETAYLSTSGTLCDSRPTALQNLDWTYHLGDYGKFYGYGAFLSMLHDRQHELHRPAFNEFETGAFYGYDWKITEDVTFFNGAGGVWGDNRRYAARYGENPEYQFFGGAFCTSTAGMQLAWQFAKRWRLYAKIRQFDTLDRRARRAEKRKTDYWARRDIAIGTVGVSFDF